jgi:mannitol-specific phosphotransferase system IIBC component
MAIEAAHAEKLLWGAYIDLVRRAGKGTWAHELRNGSPQAIHFIRGLYSHFLTPYVLLNPLLIAANSRLTIYQEV